MMIKYLKMKKLLTILLLIPNLSWGWVEMERTGLSISDYLDNGWDIVGTQEETIHLFNKKNKKYIYCKIVNRYESDSRRWESCHISTLAGE